MKTKAATASKFNGDFGEYAVIIRDGLKELAAIHRANKTDDAEIRRLQSSTRKKLDRIWKNLRHVQTIG
ncbi:MAG TPA: hypothetical protein VG754_03360 [Verrucomicrobiae bacterium]|jgi:hypothetical protein|nr:hypothetical protein [Verrucomicrobiae bacterium]